MKCIIILLIILLLVLLILNNREPYKEIDVKGETGEFLFIIYGENASIKKVTDTRYLLDIIETDNEVNAYTNQPKHIRKDITLKDFINLKNLWTKSLTMESTPNAFGYIREKDQKIKFAFKLYKPNIYENDDDDDDNEIYHTSILLEPIDDDSRNAIDRLTKIRDIDRVYLFVDNNKETAQELISKF